MCTVRSGIASVSIACCVLLAGVARGAPPEGAASDAFVRVFTIGGTVSGRSSMSVTRHQPVYERRQVEHPVDDRYGAQAQEMVGV